jgi:regulator of protease activity HflC (stomatin/prohibitin superfamily)
MKENLMNKAAITIAICLMILVPVLSIYGLGYLYGKYRLWSASIHGEAELKQAEWNRQIIVKEAIAKKDASVMLAQAEVERARGVAQANKIIGNSLKQNEDYLRYLWIDNIHNTTNQIIYVPTEANLPILEANRLKGN